MKKVMVIVGTYVMLYGLGKYLQISNNAFWLGIWISCISMMLAIAIVNYFIND